MVPFPDHPSYDDADAAPPCTLPLVHTQDDPALVALLEEEATIEAATRREN